MKRQFAFLFALTFMVSGMATMAEQAAVENPELENLTVETEIVETADVEWVAPFEDGEWLQVPEWNAEVYLPAGWTLTEVTEGGFIASDADAAETVTVTMEDFVVMETETVEMVEKAGTDEAAETEAVEISAFEAYLMGLGEEYELVLMGEREAAIFPCEDCVTVRFVQNDQLVTMVFEPVVEGGASESALAIAETFYIYDVEAEETEAMAEEAVAETDAAAEEAAAETDAE